MHAPSAAESTSEVVPYMETAPVMVLDPYFCAPYEIELTMVKKLISFTDGDYTVTDMNGNLVFTVKGVLLNIHRRRVVQDATGRPIVSLQQKMLTAHKRWKAFRGDSSEKKDILFTVRKSSLIQIKTSMDVFLAGNTAEKVCDFRMKGKLLHRGCVIYLGDTETVIAETKKKHTAESIVLDKTTYRTAVHPHVDFAFVMALVVIYDEIIKDKKEDDD